MYNLFLIMLAVGVTLLIISTVLYFVWGIPDAVDEVSGKKRKRQIEKLQRAIQAIGATDVVSSTTQMLKYSNEEEEISDLISSIHLATAEVPNEPSLQKAPSPTNKLWNSSSLNRKASVKIVQEVSNL